MCSPAALIATLMNSEWMIAFDFVLSLDKIVDKLMALSELSYDVTAFWE